MTRERYPGGWVEVWGPRAPALRLDFYRSKDVVGEFGISTTYITVAGLTQDATADEIAALARQLGLQWPPE